MRCIPGHSTGVALCDLGMDEDDFGLGLSAPKCVKFGHNNERSYKQESRTPEVYDEHEMYKVMCFLAKTLFIVSLVQFAVIAVLVIKLLMK